MIITKEIINQNTIKLIGEVIKAYYELPSEKPEENNRYTKFALGAIGGMIDMAQALKEVLDK